MDTYRNPIWGDPAGSTMRHSFLTSRSASTTLHHTMMDVDLQRKVFFMNHRYLLMIDRFQGNQPHSVALNFNYLGTLQQDTDTRLRIRRQESELSMFTMGSSEVPPQIVRDFSIYTPRGGPRPAGSFRIETYPTRSGYFATLLYPHRPEDAPRELIRQPVIGEGDMIRLRNLDGESAEVDLAVNRGQLFETERWKSDGKVVWVMYDPSLQIKGLLLVDFTVFQSDRILLQSDFPVTLFLEDHDSHWQGYVEASDETQSYHLTISGIHAFPFRFNRIPVIPRSDDGSRQRYRLTGSGALDIGSGMSPVIVPYPFHTTPGLLQWLSQQPQPHRQFAYWSDYQKQLFRNEIMMNFLYGMESGLRYWEQRLFQGQPTFMNAAYTLSGVLEESYSRNSPSTFFISVPHRYQFQQTTGNISWSVFEEGSFSPTNLEIQNVQLNAHWQNGRGISYRGSRRFKDHQSHHIRLFASNGSQGFYQIARFQEQVEQQAQLYLRGNRAMLNPGYRWGNPSQTTDAFLNWRMHRFQGSMRRIQSGDSVQFHQTLSGFGGAWAFSVEGQQTPAKDRQQYRVNWFYSLNPTLTLSQGGKVEKRRLWHLPAAFTEFLWRPKRLAVRGRIERRDEMLHQQLSAYWHRNSHQLSGSVDLKAFAFGRENRLQARWSYRGRSGFSAHTNLVYQYWQTRQRYAVDVFHTLAIPIRNHLFWQPIFGESIPSPNPLQWLGSGVSYFGRHTLFGQFLIHRQVDLTSVEYQFAMYWRSRHQHNSPLVSIWLNLQQQGDRVYRTEMRVQPRGGTFQPGLYYSYLRGAGSRLEGYLQWRW